VSTLYGTVLERHGRFTLEHNEEYDYFGISHEQSPEGGKHGMSLGKDERVAREAWRELLAKSPCRECGEPPFGKYMEPTQSDMEKRGLCFSCNHWTDVVAETKPGRAVIAGFIYSIGEDELSIARRCGWPAAAGRLRSDYRHVLGHGGAEFSIEFFDGSQRTTTNLWAGGQIPDHFRERLPDNARFLKRAEYSAYVGGGSASEVGR